MTVTVKIQDSEGNLLTEFQAENERSIADMSEEQGVEILQSCSEGYCGTCLCNVDAGAEMVEIDKTGDHLYDLEMDENNNPKQILACIGGIKDEYFEDGADHSVVVTKLY